LVSVLVGRVFLALVKIKAVVEPVETLRVKSCHLGGGSGFQILSLAFIKVAQQSVQPTGGTLPHFQAFFWLRFFSALEANLVPPTSG